MPYLVLQIHYGDIEVFRGESARLHGPASTLTRPLRKKCDHVFGFAVQISTEIAQD